MKKIISTLIPISALLIFILIMLSGNYLKYPLSGGDDVPKSIQIVINDVEAGKWNEANKDLKKLESSWKKVVKRIQFSSERDEINALTDDLARLQGIIKSKNKPMALAELYEAYEHWRGLAR